MGFSTMHMAPGDPARQPLIRMLGVAKAYRSAEGEVESLKPLAFDIHEGEFLSIVGPSGCGKSTLLKLLLAWRTVLENIMLQIEVRKLPHERGLEHARELVEMVGLKGFENKYPWQLSGGMQQRASICRALVHDPAILLMDEPFGALDAMTREKMNLELQRIWSAAKKTVLLITHSIPESIFLSDRVLVMSERPGAIAAIYDVPLPRPRTLAMMGGTAFGALAQKIRAHFYAQGSLDA